MPNDEVAAAVPVCATETQTVAASQRSAFARPWVVFILVFLACGMLAMALQYRTGAYDSELAHYPDEAGHFVTALMVRDFVVRGFQDHPVRFAESYYLHYPKVAFGMWPPLFHILTGAWLTVLPAKIDSVLVLLSIITAATAASLFLMAQRLFGRSTALVVAFAYVVLPLSQRSSSMIMVDSLIALFMLWVAIAFGKYLTTERMRDALIFGGIAGLAALTKGNGVAAVLIPPIAILALRRWQLLLKPQLYCAAALVVVLAAPWQLMTAQFLKNTITFHEPGLEFTANMSVEYVRVLFRESGPLLFVLALVGLALTLVRVFRQTVDPLWTALASQLLAILLFHVVVPVPGPEPRYMLAAMPAILLFGVLAISHLTTLIPFTRAHRPVVVALGTIAAIVVSFTTSSSATHLPFGFRDVAAALQKDAALADGVYMVASDAGGEGALIAEVAALDNPRPRHFVLRASKTLAEATWYSRNYRLLLTDSQKVTDFLDQTGTQIVVFDRSAPEMPHSKLLLETIRSHPEQWTLASTTSKARHLDVYRCRREPDNHRQKLEIRMRYTLGRDIHE